MVDYKKETTAYLVDVDTGDGGIVRVFCEECRTHWVTIPTNGTLTGAVLDTTQRILAECPNVLLTVQVSVDGTWNEYEELRAVPGMFGKVQDTLNRHGKALKDNRILILGAAYKPDIDDIRESPALDVIGLLKEKMAEVSYHDPYISELSHDDWTLASETDLMKAVKKADCVVIITNHASYDYQAIHDNAKLIVYTRNALGKINYDRSKVEPL